MCDVLTWLTYDRGLDTSAILAFLPCRPRRNVVFFPITVTGESLLFRLPPFGENR